MRKNGYEYGYRVGTWDYPSCTYGFAETVLSYIKCEKIKPTFFLEMFHGHLNPPDVFAGCKVWDRYGYYNNFHITKLSFWKDKRVQSFLKYLDRIGGGYKYRWNDLIVSSTAVQIFMQKEKLYHFKDFDYDHTTWMKGGKIGWGGFYPANGDISKHCMQTTNHKDNNDSQRSFCHQSARNCGEVF